MRGEVGKSYKLIVQHHGQTFEALTTIPTVVDIDSVIVSKTDGAEGKLRVHISLADDPATKDYYKIFSNDYTESKMLLSSTMQTFDDAILSGHNTMPVYRGQTYLNQDYDADFLPGERLTINSATSTPTPTPFGTNTRTPSLSRATTSSSSPRTCPPTSAAASDVGAATASQPSKSI